MKTTLQKGSATEPKDSDRTLAIIIICPNCDTQRAFKINDAMEEAILPRNSSGMEWITWCEECGREFKFQLCWTERKPGWTGEKIIIKEEIGSVEDMMGLTKTKSERTI